MMKKWAVVLTRKKKTKINISYESTKNKGIHSRLVLEEVGYKGKGKDGNMDREARLQNFYKLCSNY